MTRAAWCLIVFSTLFFTYQSHAGIIFNEIMQNPSRVSDSSGEWFELYNTGGTDIDINGWTVKDNDSDSYIIDSGGPLIIKAGGFLVLSNNIAISTNGGVMVNYQYSGMFLSNSSDELILLNTLLEEIDRVEWDNGLSFPDPNGSSMALSSSSLDNNIGANWLSANFAFGDGDSGTPGSCNSDIGQVCIQAEQIPEPNSLALITLALACFARRRKH